MLVCGINLSGSDAIFVLLSGENTSFEHIELNTCKITLGNSDDSQDLRAFQNTIYAFFREHPIDVIVIKKKGKGMYAGGPSVYKMETIIQLYDQCDTVLVHPSTVAATMKKHNPNIPDSLYKYQESAFAAAFARLP